MDLNFVPATEADRAFFIRVHHAAYRAVIEQMFGWDEALQDRKASEAFDAEGMHVIWCNDQKIGVVGWENRPDYIWFKEFFLLPEYQKQGIGGRVLDISIAKAKEAGKDLRLQTLKANLEGKRFYERHGFTVTEATDIHWKLVLKL